jgi:hypothetical protein
MRPRAKQLMMQWRAASHWSAALGASFALRLGPGLHQPLIAPSRLAFRRLISVEEFVPNPELVGLRSQVVANSGRLVTGLSRIRLTDITQQVRQVVGGGLAQAVAWSLQQC